MLRWRKNGKRRAVKLGRVETTRKEDVEKKALEKFVWVANGDAITKASDATQHENFDVVKNDYVRPVGN